MKKIMTFLLVAAMAMSLIACGKKENNDASGKFKAGTYEGTAKGFGGEIKATVKLSADKIDEITVVGDKETEGVGSVAVKNLPTEMVSKQAVEIDGVSGATVSSNAIKEAVTAALKEAGVDASSLKASATTETKKETKTLDVDTVIVGAGGAGMTAALEAKAAGLNVVIVEKMSMAGGNSVKATGGMNAAATSVQKKLGIKDDVKTFVNDTMEGGHNVNDKKLVTIMAKDSASAIDWLASIGAPLDEVSFSGGATNKRIHRPAGGAAVGSYLVKAFQKNLEKEKIEVIYNTEAKEVIMKDGKASGIKAEGKDADYTINAKSVILATGGFGANEELYTKYRPELKGYVTTNAPGATGDGIVMGEEVGAATVDMDQIQIHPTVEQSTSLLVTESVRGEGAILVNSDAKRFTNELLTRDVVSANIIKQKDSYAYLIFDQDLRDNLSAVEEYVEAGIVKQADSIEGLAKETGLDAATLKTTVDTWNKAVANKKDSEFGRDTGMERNISKKTFYAIKIAPGVHHTMGGLKINTSTEVLNTKGKVIDGLFAAGEVTGGVHGGNRIGGNAVADFVVFGRIAGETAAKYVKAAK
ncbi:fumarate reductase flavoprotein subunit [Lachnospiraceae bacterium KM106-2]|nr:fumarate reductase flavoprotein subunit [Lachnospiraceae bacterium KM106-2]